MTQMQEIEEGSVREAQVPAQTVKAKRQAASSAAINMLPALVNAAQWGQQDQLKEQLVKIAEVIGEQYPGVAKKLVARLPMTQLRLKQLPVSLISAGDPRHGLSHVVLGTNVLSELQAVINEHRMAKELAEYKLEPRHRILLHGSPGNGKTMAAEALAHELGVPFLQIKYGGLIDSHLGGTAKNINTVLEFAAQSPCVLFADEFDGLGGSRSREGDVGEARRITNQLLIELERMPSHCVFVAATNMTELMDKALLRRFDFVIEITSPSPEMVQACVRMELRPEITPGHSVLQFVEDIAAIRFSSMFRVVELCKKIRRDLVLNEGRNIAALLAEAKASTD